MDRRSPRNAVASIGENGEINVPDLKAEVEKATTRKTFELEEDTEIAPRKPNMSVSRGTSRSSRRSPRNAVPTIDDIRPSFTMKTTDRVSASEKSLDKDQVRSSRNSVSASEKSLDKDQVRSSRKSVSASEKSLDKEQVRSSRKSVSASEKSLDKEQVRSSRKSVSTSEKSLQRKTSDVIIEDDSPSTHQMSREKSTSKGKEKSSDAYVPSSSSVFKTFIKETGTSLRQDVKVDKSREKKHTEKNVKFYYPDLVKKRIPEGKKLIETKDGNFLVPDYDAMSPDELQRERNSLEIKYIMLNNNWKKEGYQFRELGSDESTLNGEIRYQMLCNYISAKTGCDMYKMMLFGTWILTEGILCYMRIPANGYFESQLMMFDIYNRKLVEMGKSPGIGKDWSPMTVMVLYSLINAAIVIFLNKMSDDGQGGHSPKARMLMRKVAEFVSGSGVKTDAAGVPVPADPIGDTMSDMGLGELGDLAGMFGGEGGNASTALGSAVTDMIGGGGGGGIGSIISAFMGGGNSGGNNTRRPRTGPRHRH